MRTLFSVFLALAMCAVLAYSGIAMFAGRYSATPIVNLIGPGDLPSVCAERSRPYFERNEKLLREIAELVIDADHFTKIWVTDSTDFWHMTMVNEDTGISEIIEPTDNDFEVFYPLFKQLQIRDFNSPVLFSRSGDRVAAPQLAAACGPSILDWVKFRLAIGKPSKGRPHAHTLAYVFWPNGVEGISICPEPLPAFEDSMLCEIKLSENWTWHSEWAPKHILYIDNTDFEQPPLAN